MKRFFLGILTISASLIATAQSVMGIPFGSSYETTLSSLKKRFGVNKIYESNGVLKIYDFSMGDFEFTFGSFAFQFNGDNSFLNSAEFSKPYEKAHLEIAKSDRDYLYSLLKDKYADEYLEEYTNEQGFKCYKFGLNPYDETKVLGLITLRRADGKDGKERYYLNLDYLPIHYIDKASDF